MRKYLEATQRLREHQNQNEAEILRAGDCRRYLHE